MVPACRLISNFSSALLKPFETVTPMPITIGIGITLIFHSFLCYLGRSKYLSLFSLTLTFILSSDKMTKSTIWQVFFLSFTNYIGLQSNWGKHKYTRFYLIWGCWIQIRNPFLLITSSFFRYAYSAFCACTAHKGVYEFRVNSYIMRLMAYFFSYYALNVSDSITLYIYIYIGIIRSS